MDQQYPPRFGEELERAHDAERARSAGDGEDPGAPEAPGAPGALGEIFWFVLLFVRPRLFFLRYGRKGSVAITFACAVSFGLAGAIGRIDQRLATGRMSNLITTWESYWGFAIVAGLIGAALVVTIGGWWYRLRLKWSGAADPDQRASRRVYVHAAQITAIPVVVYAFGQTLVYPDPQTMMSSGINVFDVALIFLPFYSFVVSFIGVRTVFDVGLGRSLWWFLILPALWTALVVGAAFALAFLLTAVPPDLSRPNAFNGYGTAFRYPANWWIADKTFEDGIAEITIEPPQDAFAKVVRYESVDSVADEIAYTVAIYTGVFEDLEFGSEFDRLGGLSGSGETYRALIQGDWYTFRVFIVPGHGDWKTEFQSLCLPRDEEMLEPGFELIYESMN